MAKYTMPSLIKKYYESWLYGPSLFDNPNDVERFYRFTKACIRYGRKHRNGHWLRHFLKKDLLEKYDDEYREDLIQNAVSLFDNLMDFCRVTFPDHVLEMRDPYLVFERQLLTAWYYRTISYSSKTKIFQHNAFFTCITNSEMVYNLVK